MLRDGSFRFGPERRAIGYLARFAAFFFHKLDRHRERARMFAHDSLDLASFEIVLRCLVQMENDPRPRTGASSSTTLNRKSTLAVRTPMEGFMRARAPRENIDASATMKAE